MSRRTTFAFLAMLGIAACKADAPATVDLGMSDSAGISAADYTCLGAFTHGPVQATVTHTIHVDSLKTKKVSVGTPLQIIDPSTLLGIGPIAMLDDNSDAHLSLPSNALVAWKITGMEGCPDTCVDSYAFGALTISADAATAGGADLAKLYDIDDYVGLLSLAGVAIARLDDTGIVVGTVLDCSGAPVQNASVELSLPSGAHAVNCTGTGTVPDAVCVVYFDTNGFIDVRSTGTNRDGRFAVFNAAGAVSLDVTGELADGSRTTVGSLALTAIGRAVSFGTVYPR